MRSSKQRRAELFGDRLLEQSSGPLSVQEEAAAAEASFSRVPGALMIPLERLAPNPDNPRRESKNLEELALSIADRGALQNLVVRRDPDRPGYYLVIAGNRRLAAAQLLRSGAVAGESTAIHELPCVIADDATGDAFADAMAENVAREDLTRAEMMDGVLRLHDTYGWSARAIARRIGRHYTDVAELLRLAREPDVAALVRREAISASVGATIVGLPHPTRAAVLAEVEAGRVRSAADVARLVASPRARTEQGDPTTMPPPAVPVVGVGHPEPSPGVPTLPARDPRQGLMSGAAAGATPDPPAGTQQAAPAPLERPDRAGVGLTAAGARYAAQAGLRQVAQFHDTDFQAVLDLLAYGKAYRRQWQTVIDELLRERATAVAD